MVKNPLAIVRPMKILSPSESVETSEHGNNLEYFLCRIPWTESFEAAVLIARVDMTKHDALARYITYATHTKKTYICVLDHVIGANIRINRS